MKYGITLLMLISFGIIPRSWADDGTPQVRTSLTQTDEIWEGQNVPLIVELLVPGYFAGSPTFDLPKVPGLLIFPPKDSPTVSSEEINGIYYSVQRHRLTLLPRVSSQVKIPEFEIRFGYKHEPLDSETIAAAAKTSAVSFTAKSPPTNEKVENWITSEDLTIHESWKPVPASELKMGEALVRTIVWKATDLPAMAFPPFDPEPIPGIGMYRADPIVTDTSERGRVTAERVDTITYVAKSGGHFLIPALSIQWWDPKDREMKQVDFPERKFHVIVPPVPPEKITVRFTRMMESHWDEILSAIAGIVICGISIRYAWPSLVRFIKRLHPRHLVSLNPSE